MPARIEIKRFGDMVGGSRRMRKVYSMIRKGAVVDMPVLIVGETGSGKGMVARELHRRSSRAEGPYVAINTGAIAEELVASELFGHRKGAFTGATEDKLGRLREAKGGTLFLDEIGTMDARMQIALLRALEARKIRPVGAKRDISIDFRLIAATNENLEQAVHEGRFRDDLLYRLRVLSIKLPPLRARPEDLPMLCADFLMGINAEYGFQIEGVSDETMAILQEYEWPGNLRELKNVLAQATVTAVSGLIAPEHLPGHIADTSQHDFDMGLGMESHTAPMDMASLQPSASANAVAPPTPGPAKPHQTIEPSQNNVTYAEEPAAPSAPPVSGVRQMEDGLFIPVGSTLEEVQRAYTLKTLESCNNNKTQAAKLLNVSRKALYDKLVRWGDDKTYIQ